MFGKHSRKPAVAVLAARCQESPSGNRCSKSAVWMPPLKSICLEPPRKALEERKGKEKCLFAERKARGRERSRGRDALLGARRLDRRTGTQGAGKEAAHAEKWVGDKPLMQQSGWEKSGSCSKVGGREAAHAESGWEISGSCSRVGGR
eukprot:359683-Chlamydomonas_euryale.AAC.4